MNKVLLGDVAEEVRENYKEMDGNPAVVGLEHLIPGEIRLKEWSEDTNTTFTKAFHKGQVLFGRRRAYLKKAAVAPVDGICSGDITVISAKQDKILPELLPFVIQNDDFFDFAVGKSAGSLSPRVKWSRLKEYEFNLPSLSQQRKLAKLLWSFVDAKEAYEDLIRQTDELVKSQFIEMFGPIDQESHWKRVPWKKVLNIINGKDYKKVPCDKGTYPVYGTGGEMARVDEYLCPENSVLVGRKGTIDHPLLVKEKFWNVDTAFGLVPNENLNYEYLYWFCLQFDFWSINKGTTLPSTTKADLEKIEINVPPVELQNQFATIVHQSDKSKFELNEAIKDLDAMYKRIIKDNLG